MLAWFNALTFFEQFGLVYIILINIVTFFYFGFDKMQSRSQGARVRERVLWLLTLIGGSIGALLGMKCFRHKTKKISFQAGIALILAIQIGLALFLLTEKTPTYF